MTPKERKSHQSAMKHGRGTILYNLLRDISSLGLQDIYTDAPEYAERVEQLRDLMILAQSISARS